MKDPDKKTSILSNKEKKCPASGTLLMASTMTRLRRCVLHCPHEMQACPHSLQPHHTPDLPDFSCSPNHTFPNSQLFSQPVNPSASSLSASSHKLYQTIVISGQLTFALS